MALAYFHSKCILALGRSCWQKFNYVDSADKWICVRYYKLHAIWSSITPSRNAAPSDCLRTNLEIISMSHISQWSQQQTRPIWEGNRFRKITHLKRSCPAVSQIWSLTNLLTTLIIFEPNSTPIVWFESSLTGGTGERH